MPFAGRQGGAPTVGDAIVPLHRGDFDGVGSAIAAIVTLPGQALVSALLAAGAWLALHRRGRTAEAAAWAAALVLATMIEVATKGALARPVLHRGALELEGFHHSWPSGHTVRAAVLALTVAAVWPRARPLLALWLIAVVALLEVSGAHTPSDLLGGLLLAALVGAAAAESSALLRGLPRARRRGASRRRRRD
jgi:membrane-associated phospholipid phosphatase